MYRNIKVKTLVCYREQSIFYYLGHILQVNIKFTVLILQVKIL